MKPILLTMTAFGSYAEETKIEFNSFDHGLYLITGDTGAGKTTIFDGIMFALFGQASGMPESAGNGKSLVGYFRTLEMMHSDYADKLAPTIVSLKFEHDGKEHEVTRTFRYRKSRKNESTVYEAEFKEAGKEVIQKPTNVDARITELIGLNAEQFRKIVMLAQGEFAKFLTAKSEERQKIIGELFGDSMYLYYQNLLGKAQKKLSEEREEYLGKIRRALNELTQDPNLPEEDKVLYLSEHTELVENLQALIDQDDLLLESLSAEHRKYEKENNELRQKKGAAEGQNQSLEELKRQREKFRQLEQEEASMQQRQAHLKQVEKAFIYVLPREKAYRQATSNREKALLTMQQLEARMATEARTMESARQNLDKWEPEREKIVELTHEIKTIEGSRENYSNLKKALDARALTERTDQKEEQERSTARQLLEKQNQMLNRCSQEIESLEGIDAQAEILRSRDAENAHRLEALTGKGGVTEYINKVRNQQDHIEKEVRKLRSLTEIARKDAVRYLELYTAFIDGQAGIIAESVSRQLEEHGQAQCPVCKTRLIRGKFTALAEKQAETPDQKTVDAAKKRADQSERDRSDVENKIRADREIVANNQQIVLNQFRRIVPDCNSWEEMLAPGYLDLLIRDYTEEKSRGEAALAEVVQKSGRLSALKKQKKDLEKNKTDLETRLSDLEKKQNERRLELHRLTGQITALTAQLPYASWTEAYAQQKLLMQKRTELTGKVRDAEEQLKKAQSQYENTKGAWKKACDEYPETERAEEDQKEEFLREMQKQGFDHYDQVQSLLDSIPYADGNIWISEERNIFQKYQQNRKFTMDRIQELEKLTSNYQWTDLTALQEQLQQVSAKADAASRRYTEQYQVRQNHDRIRSQVRDARARLADTDKAWAALDSLASLAAGVASEDGKMDFDSYVMGAVFREVLVAANERLRKLSKDRYSLENDNGKVRINSKTGMNIRVYDSNTQKIREAASLSGGEKFLASLSLALGLSDIVQGHAGGVRLDALFIDEGFGSLDGEILDQALAVLGQLTEGNRLVGIISHVQKLEESIPQQIRVKAGKKGSTITYQK